MAPLFLVGKKVTDEAPPSKTYTLLTSVHNDADDANDANNYTRVSGVAQLKAFSCAKNSSKVTGLIEHLSDPLLFLDM